MWAEFSKVTTYQCVQIQFCTKLSRIIFLDVSLFGFISMTFVSLCNWYRFSELINNIISFQHWTLENKQKQYFHLLLSFNEKKSMVGVTCEGEIHVYTCRNISSKCTGFDGKVYYLAFPQHGLAWNPTDNDQWGWSSSLHLSVWNLSRSTLVFFQLPTAK